MEYGAHLPLIDLGGGLSLRRLNEYARAASACGYRYLCANDHLLFTKPWLDGPTALAALAEVSADLKLVTSVALPVVRGPAQLAKTLAAIDVLSGGRLIVGVGAGSSVRDYAAAGVPFDTRWRRFDEALQALRVLLEADPGGFEGEFYSLSDVRLEPPPLQRPRPPIWVASWGTAAGLRRVARRGDGWLASAYNITPEGFRECLDQLAEQLRAEGKPADGFPNALATTWLYITDKPSSAEHMITDVLAPMLNRPVETLRSLPIGPAEVCTERLSAFARAGVQRLFLWPLRDETRQLQLFSERVAPLL